MTAKLPIYLDYMSTTPVDPRVIAKMLDYLGPKGVFGNPSSSTHAYGRAASCAVERAREQIAATISAEPGELVFTSGATEADNLAIIGAARFYQRKGRHLITMVTEHKAVLDSFKQLQCEGFEVSYLSPQPDGLLDYNTLEKAIRPDTILVSIMHVNNELGVVNDIAAIASLLRNRGIVFHVDAAQSAGKIPINLQEMGVDLMSFSAHKNYGPKGIGALFVRKNPRIRIQTLTYGGGHEGGLRSGTLPTHQIVGMGEAFEIANASLYEEQSRILKMRKRLWEGIHHLRGIQLNGHPTQRVAGHLNISFGGIESSSLLVALHELAISTTSACTSGRNQASYVLRALGMSEELAYSSLRLTLGRFTTDEQVDAVIKIICYQINRLRDLSPI